MVLIRMLLSFVFYALIWSYTEDVLSNCYDSFVSVSLKPPWLPVSSKAIAKNIKVRSRFYNNNDFSRTEPSIFSLKLWLF